MNYETLTHEIADGILTLTLNRPAQLNAFVPRMGEELIQAFNDASENDNVRAIIVTGAGRAFCAGMDLVSVNSDPDSKCNAFGQNEALQPTMADMDDRFDDPEIIAGVRDAGGRVTLAIFDCKKPVIAAVNGAAVGFGATMTLAMDIRLASDKARFGFVFSKLGIVPEACSSWFLPKIVGISKALEWMYSAEIISAAEALRCNLVNEVVAAAELLPRARRFASMLANERSPVSTALIRQMMYRNSALPNPLEAHKVESLGMAYTTRVEGKEGVAAFIEKRPAKFTSRASKMPPFYPWWPR
jgi:enoyl-CoA hydratase/carnithine racemase